MVVDGNSACCLQVSWRLSQKLRQSFVVHGPHTAVKRVCSAEVIMYMAFGVGTTSDIRCECIKILPRCFLFQPTKQRERRATLEQHEPRHNRISTSYTELSSPPNDWPSRTVAKMSTTVEKVSTRTRNRYETTMLTEHAIDQGD